MKNLFWYVLADPDFYAPAEGSTDPGEALYPEPAPSGWQSTQAGVWRQWYRDRPSGVQDGWKVHVSARPGRLSAVLDAVAEICFARSVPFKHLSHHAFYHWTHAKQGTRSAGGKFIAAFPSSPSQASALMAALSARLADEEGPYILTDRRWPGSRTVHYRYGAFTARREVRADGTRRLLVRDGHGRLVEDRREPGFRVPDGIRDPFTPAPVSTGAGTPRPQAASRVLRGFAVEEAIRFSNAGGTYRGCEIATGRPVFIKEARAHCGVTREGRTAPEILRAEWETLRTLHALAPGLAPAPLAHFRVWEHDFLATELIPGRTLSRWASTTSPLLRSCATRAEVLAYYRRCQQIIGQVEAALERLHGAGYLFNDVSPDNVLVDDEDRVRLVDFEVAHVLTAVPLAALGTPGYSPPPGLVDTASPQRDDYGVCALAHLLLGPLQQVARRNPNALRHQHYELCERAPVPAPLWNRVTRYHRPTSDPVLPSPQEVAADPLRHVAALRDGVADALLATARPGHPTAVFPTIAEGYQTNTMCVAYGTAGVIHALAQAGRPVPDGLLQRLRHDAINAIDALAPGFYIGASGIAHVLAGQGMLDEAADLLTSADRHPLVGECATLYGGSAGVAMAHLALYGHTGDDRHLARAAGLAESLPADDELTELLGPDDATGLLHGRTGIALMLQQLAALTGDTRYLSRAVRLLHRELDRAVDPSAPDLTFPVSAGDRRAMAYLLCGSAGLVPVVTRCLRATPDPRLAAALPRLLTPLEVLMTVMPGLYQGLSGYGIALADHSRLTGDPQTRSAAVRVARGLFKYAIPHESGIRFLGDQSLRYSADLYSGMAGVLLFLTQLLEPRPDALFTVDALTGAERQAAQGDVDAP